MYSKYSYVDFFFTDSYLEIIDAAWGVVCTDGADMSLGHMLKSILKISF